MAFVPGGAFRMGSNHNQPEVRFVHSLRVNGHRMIKDRSYLCASNFCSLYRPAARQPQEVDLGAVLIGFRTVLNRTLRESER